MTLKQKAFRTDEYEWNMSMARAVSEGGTLSGVLREFLHAYAGGMTGPAYFTSSSTKALLRRDAGRDEFYGKDGWEPTTTIAEYMVGEENNVSPITEAQARKLVPAAFN